MGKLGQTPEAAGQIGLGGWLALSFRNTRESGGRVAESQSFCIFRSGSTSDPEPCTPAGWKVVSERGKVSTSPGIGP